MDLGDADELDYEEGEPADELVETDLQNENLSGSEDQYLQIDCPEDVESLFSCKEPVNDVCTETQNVQEAGTEEKERKNLSLQNSSPGAEQVIATVANNSDGINGINTTINTIPTITKTTYYKKKRSNPFRQRSDVNEKIFNGSNVSPLLPERYFGVVKNNINRYSVCTNLQETLNRGCHPNQSLFSPAQRNLQPLMSIKSKTVPFLTLNSFSPIGAPKYNLIRRRNKSVHHHYSWPSFNNNHLKFQNNKKIMSENFECKTGAFEYKTNTRKRKNLQICNDKFQTVETQRNFKHRIFHDQNLKSPGSEIKLNEHESEKKNNNSTLDLCYNFMKPEEKELVSLKKEARLKRFSNDEMVRKEKISIDSGVDEKYKKWNLENLEKEYFQKMAEQKLTREKFFSLKEQRRNSMEQKTDQSFQIEKPNIHKESLLEKRNPFDFFARFKNFSNFQIEKPNLNKDTLLKKRNPFDESSRRPKLSLETEIKRESETCKEVKKEHFGDKSVGSVKIDSQLIKEVVNNMTSLSSASQSFCDVKSETKSPVKFVRTVSKCFDELAFKKPKPEVIVDKNANELPFSNQLKSFPSLEKNKMNTLIQNFPSQIESQLTGCIVKVLNIPPTTTTNDILALCCPIGMVREVKLNFPKENSVVIRFVEPACAEKFFSLYHGQKMNNYFLNEKGGNIVNLDRFLNLWRAENPLVESTNVRTEAHEFCRKANVKRTANSFKEDSVTRDMTMSEGALLNGCNKARSASICAPGCSSMEALALSGQLPPSGGGTPDTGTPSGRRRRPAARSQSARVTGGKSVRRRTPNAEGSLRTGSSEPRIDTPGIQNATPEVSPAIKRKSSTRRSLKQAPRKSAAFLDVPNLNTGPMEGEDEDSYRLRSFSFTSKGVVNRGDSFRRRRSRSNSLAPPGLAPQDTSTLATVPATPQEVTSYRVALVGAQGVGKTALISQFMSSECINAYDRSHYESNQQVVSIMLNGEESELHFENIRNPKSISKSDPPDAFVVLYSVIDKASFQKAETELNRLVDMDLLRTRPAILVANKIDLARSRTISSQDGKCLACTFRAKYIEVSVGINHNIDELLVGILNQIRLKLTNAQLEDPDSPHLHWYNKSRGVVRASMKARQMLTWLFGKEDTKFKNCENLQVL